MRGFFRSVALIIRQNLKLRDTLTYAYYLAAAGAGPRRRWTWIALADPV
jgi:hypothetical protein